MECTIVEQNGVIVRRFTGDTRMADIIEAWKTLFTAYPKLDAYKGIVSIYLDADIRHEEGNLNTMVEYLKDYLEHLKDLKIAVVMDTPLVTNTIILGQRMEHLQIKPFSSVEAAFQWIEL
jgi:hypothetical protein